MRSNNKVKESWVARRSRLRHALAWTWLAAPLTLGAVELTDLSVAGKLLAALIAVALSTVLLANHPTYRRWLEREADSKRRRQRAVRREDQLRSMGVAPRLLVELSALVEDVRTRDPASEERHDLDGLLDHYVELAVALEQCRAVQAANRREPLMASLSALGEGAAESARGRVLMRRLASHDQCARVADRVGTEIEALVEIIRWFSQRAALSSIHTELDAVTRVLGDLEHEEAANDEVARCTLGSSDRPRLQQVAS